MIDQEMLQAVGKLMDDKLDAQRKEIKSDLKEQKSEIMQEVGAELQKQRGEIMQDVTQLLNLMIENHFDPRFNLLAEQLQTVTEKLAQLDDLEVMDTRITALEAMVKKINRELKELKKAE